MTDNAERRIALVGPTSMVGAELKARLADAGYPGAAVKLLDLDEQVGLLTEYGDEARAVVEAAEESLREHRLVCFCGDPETALRFAPVVRDAGGLAIDCTGAWTADPGARPATSATAASTSGSGIVAIAHPGTLLLTSLREALGEDLDTAVVTMLLPASEASERGPDELAGQAAAFLNFGDSPEDVFERRLVFDAYLDAAGIDSADLICAELAEIGAPAPSLSTVRVSIFHGLAASIRLPAGPDATRQKLESAGIVVGPKGPDDNPVDSPARAAGSLGPTVAALREDGHGGTWLWALLDNYRATADAALALIAAHLPPEPETVN